MSKKRVRKGKKDFVWNVCLRCHKDFCNERTVISKRTVRSMSLKSTPPASAGRMKTGNTLIYTFPSTLKRAWIWKITA